jgi:hypothetical protein
VTVTQDEVAEADRIADENYESRPSDIKKYHASFTAFYEQGGQSVVQLIDYLAESYAYQLALNRFYRKRIRELKNELRLLKEAHQ